MSNFDSPYDDLRHLADIQGLANAQSSTSASFVSRRDTIASVRSNDSGYCSSYSPGRSSYTHGLPTGRRPVSIASNGSGYNAAIPATYQNAIAEEDQTTGNVKANAPVFTYSREHANEEILKFTTRDGLPHTLKSRGRLVDSNDQTEKRHTLNPDALGRFEGRTRNDYHAFRTRTPDDGPTVRPHQRVVRTKNSSLSTPIQPFIPDESTNIGRSENAKFGGKAMPKLTVTQSDGAGKECTTSPPNYDATGKSMRALRRRSAIGDFKLAQSEPRLERRMIEHQSTGSFGSTGFEPGQNVEEELCRTEETERILNTALMQAKNLVMRQFLHNTFFPEATDPLDSPTQKRQRGTSSSSSQASQRYRQTKRVRGGGRDPGDEGDDSNPDDDEQGDRPRKNNVKRAPDGNPSRRLKCPFYQRHPQRYGKASCRGEGFADMAKLKDHIKRVHTQPLRCPRCREPMSSEEACSVHLQADIICKNLPEPRDDRIRPQTLKRLDFKRAPYANARNNEEKWKLLYRALFPDDNEIPSPYDHHGMPPQLERALFEALEEELSKEFEPIFDRIKQRVPGIIESCRRKLADMTPESDTISTPGSSFIVTDSEQLSRTTSQCSGSAITSSEDLSSRGGGRKIQYRQPDLRSDTWTIPEEQQCQSADIFKSSDGSFGHDDFDLDLINCSLPVISNPNRLLEDFDDYDQYFTNN